MAQWSSSYITALPDSAFACIDSSGRHYPHHDASGSLDLPHLRNALSRLGQDDTTSCGASHLRAHARAEGIGKADMDPLKAEQLTSVKWRVLAIPFGGPFKGGKDLDGEYFSPRTDIKPDWFPARPVVWHHGLDDPSKDVDLGTEDDLTKEKDGWWATVWLDRSARYWEQVSAMLAAGKVFGSSGTIGHWVRKAKDGEILRWPHVEQTLTPTPSNFFSRMVASKVAADFQSAGLSFDVTDDDLDLPDLGPDLSPDGDDPAMAHLRVLAQSEALLARIKAI